MSAILGTYNRKKISFKKGENMLYAHNGKKYLILYLELLLIHWDIAIAIWSEQFKQSKN